MSKKEKLLAAAQKSLQKGQVARAIKDYQKLVQLAPGDVRNRQKLAELLGRERRVEEALTEYESVAKHYADGGFYLKAIAVYKQMQKLDPAKVDLYHRLAELNEKQGLVGNALAEYRNLVAYYEKQEMLPEAINVLQKMRELEPENLNILVKIAETYARGGLKDKAREEFKEALALLREQDDSVRMLKLYEIFLPLYPEDSEIKIGLAQALIQTGEARKGIPVLQSLLQENPEHPLILATLAQGYRKTGDFENEKLTYQHLLGSTPDDLDLREGYIRACLDDQEDARALEELEEWKETFFKSERVAVLKEFYDRLSQSLPQNPQVRATLLSICEITGEQESPDVGTPAVEAEEAPEEETLAGSVFDEAVEDLEEIAVLTEEAEEVAEEPLAVVEELEELEELPLEFLEEVVPEEGELEEIAEEEPEEGEPEEVAQEEPEIELELELELELDEEGEATALELELGESPVDETPAGEEEQPVSAGGLRAELEEAEFYIQQGLLDEAERICRSLLANDAGCEEASSKLAEIDARRQAAPPAESGEQLLDLAAELAGEDLSGLEEGLEAFADSQKGIETQIDVEDTESHYNLGIAYKEMGLLDEAVTEFDKASASPARRVACLTLKGICLGERGAFEQGEEAFKAGLALTELTDGERISLQYEMGLLYESWGRPLEALDSFQSVADTDLFFRDAGEKVQSLRKQLGLEEGEGGDESGPKGSKDRVSYV